MDPVLFRVDWKLLAEALAMVIVLSFFVERALALIFEHRLYVLRYRKKGLKEPIAYLVSLGTVIFCEFDVIAIVFKMEHNSAFGYALTAGIVAGGSKASIKLFQDVMGAKSTVQAQADEIDKPADSTINIQTEKKEQTTITGKAAT